MVQFMLLRYSLEKLAQITNFHFIFHIIVSAVTVLVPDSYELLALLFDFLIELGFGLLQIIIITPC